MMLNKISLLVVLLVAFTANSQERYTIKNLDINNSYSNFGTTFYGDGKVVYASPKKKSYIIRNVWEGNNQPFLDLYIGDISEDGELKNVEKFSNKLNTRYHEADVAFTKDKKTVYFSRNNYLDDKFKMDSTGINLIQLYRAQISDIGEWINVEAMPFNSDQYQTGHPALSSDEKTLYFISDMPGTYGKTDVFKASINNDGTIGMPLNLGSKINTLGREMFASISGNDELYFSSDGRIDGLGGLDVYVSKIYENSITEPQNLGTPINSVKDDFAYIINSETRRGYFSSNRNGGKGDDDIYFFKELIPVKFSCNQIVEGVISVGSSNTKLSNVLVEISNLNGEIISSVFSDKDGKFEFKVDCEKEYKISGSKENFNNNFIEFKTTDENGIKLVLDLKLKQSDFISKRGALLVNINPIYFDLDKSNIRKDAAIELEKVVNIMKKYPNLKIDLGSHTDSRAADLYNLQLSQRRAKSTLNWIINKGIAAESITGQGYGETKLINNCANNVKCSEVDHQLNRRTEFVILNPEAIK
ncbi:OmpA family protein [Lutibacter sp.]|uniref:OmpA family protein n=1 Tax=Lutibacter sp. TaxID=1925666 RepID=UPI0027361A1B|nr:OmpA family protein [Lutibacter sp.]MDP3314336.1 OmpA family protein [Lutibacter sp.]